MRETTQPKPSSTKKKKKREEVLQAEDPLQLIQRVMIIQIVPLKTMVYHIGADLHTATDGRAHNTAGGYGLKEAEWSEYRESLQEVT